MLPGTAIFAAQTVPNVKRVLWGRRILGFENERDAFWGARLRVSGWRGEYRRHRARHFAETEGDGCQEVVPAPQYTKNITIKRCLIMLWGKTHSFHRFVDTQLRDLRERYGLSLWMLIRKTGDDWRLLRSNGSGYALTIGEHFRWPDTRGRTGSPAHTDAGVLLDAEAHSPPYPVNRPMKVGACLRLPLYGDGDRLLAVLCALDPEPQPHLAEHLLPSLKRQAFLLETALSWNLSLLNQQRVSDFLEDDGRDPDTGILDVTGWSRILEKERQRCRDYGLGATILRLHGTGLERCDRRQRLADSLAALVREQDMVAYLGHGQFAILLAETSIMQSLRMRARILDALAAKDLPVVCEPESLLLNSSVLQPEVLLHSAVH
jgi:hypothetical protein